MYTYYVFAWDADKRKIVLEETDDCHKAVITAREAYETNQYRDIEVKELEMKYHGFYEYPELVDVVWRYQFETDGDGLQCRIYWNALETGDIEDYYPCGEEDDDYSFDELVSYTMDDLIDTFPEGLKLNDSEQKELEDLLKIIFGTRCYEFWHQNMESRQN